jgi:ribosomal protein L11 methylase PrmA
MSRTSEETVPILFTPPMWEQRINIVKKILLSYKIREICDLGCGSGRLLEEFVYYKGMERIIGVDLDEYELWNAVENCIPGVAGYINLRKKEMKIEILKGSILEPCDKIPFQIQAVSLCEV